MLSALGRGVARRAGRSGRPELDPRRQAPRRSRTPCPRPRRSPACGRWPTGTRSFTSLIGQGYHGTHTPGVILRNVLENPAWYTAYTPYQPEISQGRLEALLNFQTMVTDLTGMEIANASMLDEGTAAAEAMTLLRRSTKHAGNGSSSTPSATRRRSPSSPPGPSRSASRSWSATRPPTWPPPTPSASCCSTRARRACSATCARSSTRSTRPAGWPSWPPTCWPARCWSRRASWGPTSWSGRRSASGCRWGSAAPTPGSWPRATSYQRALPGRLVGVSVDAAGRPAHRLALQTREQHIRREKATSNICTAQVLLAVMASMYAVYHGPEGLRSIAARVRTLTTDLAAGCGTAGLELVNDTWFDTLTVRRRARPPRSVERARSAPHQPAAGRRRHRVADRLDETTTHEVLDRPRRGVRPRRRVGDASPTAPASPTPSAAPASTSPIRSSTSTAPRPRCCATCAGSPTWTWRSTGR